MNIEEMEKQTAEIESWLIDQYELPKNEHGVMIFKSSDGTTSINLPYILFDFMQRLNEKNALQKQVTDEVQANFNIDYLLNDFQEVDPLEGRVVLIIPPPEQRTKPFVVKWDKTVEVVDGTAWMYVKSEPQQQITDEEILKSLSKHTGIATSTLLQCVDRNSTLTIPILEIVNVMRDLLKEENK